MPVDTRPPLGRLPSCWLAACAEPITEYMRGGRRLGQARARPTGSAAMVQHPWAYRGILPEQITPETPQIASISSGVDEREWQPRELVGMVGALNHSPPLVGHSNQLQLVAGVDDTDRRTTRFRTVVDRHFT